MDITRPHSLTTTTVPTEQTSVKPLPGSRIALGRGKNSLQRNNLSDYLDTAEDFDDAEQVTGSFVGVYTDDTQREYALVDLDDGRKTRVSETGRAVIMCIRYQISVLKKHRKKTRKMNQVEMNKQARLSVHFTLGELTKSKNHPEIYNLAAFCRSSTWGAEPKEV